MRGFPALAGAGALVLILAGGMAAVPAVSADAAQPGVTALYVDVAASACSDSGPGTQAVPFCTIQAAANVVQPGQTVYIENRNGFSHYTGNITITRSGTQAAPITFTNVDGEGYPDVYPSVTSLPAITLRGVQYVNLHGLYVYRGNGGTGIKVAQSGQIGLSNLAVYVNGSSATVSTGIEIDGASSDVTVSRSALNDSADTGTGIVAEPGARRIVITTNSLDRGAGTGIVLDGAVGSAVTGNTLWVQCGTALSIAGAGSSVTAENNVLNSPGDGACPAPAAALTVTAAAAPGTSADYNALYASGSDTEYSWSGTAYSTAAAFTAATGQGAHDADLPTPQAIGGARPLLDSADCTAPGELSTDINGRPRVRDPLVPVAGNGTCYADRGAFETQDPLRIYSGLKSSQAQWTAPLTVTLTIPAAYATSPWGEPVSYTFDWGDGGGPVTVTPGIPAAHTYQAPGIYQVTETAADTGGTTVRMNGRAVVGTTATPQVGLTAGPDVVATSHGRAIVADSATFGITYGPDLWEVASDIIDLGGGISTGPSSVGQPSVSPDLIRAGTYPVTITQTDLLGRTSTAAATVTAGDEYQPVSPRQDYSRGVPAHGVVRLMLGTQHVASWNSEESFVRVTVSGPRRGGSLSVYPDGGPAPKDPLLRFQPGHAASTAAVVIPGLDGKVDFASASGGPITLTVTTVGTDSQNGTVGDTYAPLTPARVLSPVKVTAHGHLAFRVSGTHGVPATAAAAVLDVTASGTRAAGFVSAYPDGVSSPGLRAADWTAGRAVTGLVTVPLRDGRVVLRNSSGGAAVFTADVVGYYRQGGTASVFLPVAVTRLGLVRIAPGRSVKIHVGGKAGLPGTGVSAAMLNLAAAGATRAGTITGWPDGTPRPAATALCYPGGQATAAAALLPAGRDGVVDLYNSGRSAVTVTVDLSGAFYSYP